MNAEVHSARERLQTARRALEVEVRAQLGAVGSWGMDRQALVGLLRAIDLAGEDLSEAVSKEQACES